MNLGRNWFVINADTHIAIDLSKMKETNSFIVYARSELVTPWVAGRLWNRFIKGKVVREPTASEGFRTQEPLDTRPWLANTPW